jgi:hypothetical protein
LRRVANLSEIAAAFFAYLVYYNVFPEEPFASDFRQAATIAQSAPRLLLDALRVETALEEHQGWNAATWTLWGGQYGGAERGNLLASEWPTETVMSNDKKDEIGDGGWGIKSGKSFSRGPLQT